MGYFKNLTANLAFNVRREEFERWEKPEIKKAFHVEFATKNASSATALLPIACILSVFIMIVYSFGVHWELYKFQLDYAIVYLALFVVSFVFNFVIRFFAKDIDKNDLKADQKITFCPCFLNSISEKETMAMRRKNRD